MQLNASAVFLILCGAASFGGLISPAATRAGDSITATRITGDSIQQHCRGLVCPHDGECQELEQEFQDSLDARRHGDVRPGGSGVIALIQLCPQLSRSHLFDTAPKRGPPPRATTS